MKRFLIFFVFISFKQHFAINPYDIQFRNPIKFLYDFFKKAKESKNDDSRSIGMFGLVPSIADEVAFMQNVKQLLKKIFPERNDNNNDITADVDQLCQMTTKKNVKAKDKDGKTVLHLLVENKMEYNSGKKSAEIQVQKARLIKHFIACGVDVNDRDNLGNTALHYMHPFHRSNISEGMLIYIISRKANLNARNNVGETPLITVTKTANGYSSKLVKIYVAHGANVNICDDNGENALLAMITKENYKKANNFAAEKGYSGFGTTITELINSGINLNAQNNEGNTALHKAVMIGDFRTVDWLKREIKIDFNIQNNQGKTPLDIAIEKDRFWSSNESMIKKLTECGAKRASEL